MKNLVMAFSLILVCSLAIARPEGGPQGAQEGKKEGVPFARMQSELGLTDEQMEKMREIHAAGGSREEMRAVLTPEQQAKAAEARKARKARKEDGLARMKKHLELSDEQVEEMRKIRQEGGSREDMRAVLTPEQQRKSDEARKRLQSAQKPPAEQ